MARRRPDFVLVLDTTALETWDVTAVDLLARLQLAARRQRGEIRLREPPAELRELIDLLGLTEVLPVEPRPGAAADRTAGTDDPCPGTC